MYLDIVEVLIVFFASRKLSLVRYLTEAILTHKLLEFITTFHPNLTNRTTVMPCTLLILNPTRTLLCRSFPKNVEELSLAHFQNLY